MTRYDALIVGGGHKGFVCAFYQLARAGMKMRVLERREIVGGAAERKLGLVGGGIFHGHMSLDQLWSTRRVLGHGDYRSTVRRVLRR